MPSVHYYKLSVYINEAHQQNVKHKYDINMAEIWSSQNYAYIVANAGQKHTHWKRKVKYLAQKNLLLLDINQ